MFYSKLDKRDPSQTFNKTRKDPVQLTNERTLNFDKKYRFKEIQPHLVTFFFTCLNM